MFAVTRSILAGWLLVSAARGTASMPPKKGDPAPPLKIAKLLNAPANAKLDWASLRGKWVVLEFWATWCGPCVAAIPHLNELSDSLKDKPVVFIAITDEKQAVVENFLKKRPIHGWVALDEGGATFRAYAVRGIPATIIVDPGGRLVVRTHPNTLSRETFDQLLSRKDPRLWEAPAPAPRESPGPAGEPGAPPLAAVVVRPSDGSGAVMTRSTSGEIRLTNVSLKDAIRHLWNWPPARVEIRGAPGPDRLTIEIRQRGAGPPELRRLGRQVVPILLKLRIHKVVRQAEVYKLRRLATSATHPQASAVSHKGSKSYHGDDRQAVFVNFSMAEIAAHLEGVLGHPVIDETEMEGGYDISLEWRTADAASVCKALQAEGLDLVPATAEVTFLVVEPGEP